MAIENSRILAEDLAQAAGVSLGPVMNISFYGNGYPAPVMFERAMVASDVPISTGQLTVTVDVNVVYEIQ